MPIERKPEFDRRLQALGLKTIGDLTTLFTLGNGVVEALKPVADQFLASKLKANEKAGLRKKFERHLKTMTEEELQRLMAVANIDFAVATVLNPEPDLNQS